MNNVKPETVVIKLLDETSAPIMTWTLHNAWPVRIQSSDLAADGHEAAIETLEMAYETLTITTG